MKNIFKNFNDPLNRWTISDICVIHGLVEDYARKKNLCNVMLESVEDNRWSDTENQRIDVEIQYPDDAGRPINQKLLILKGEILDGNEFHKRFNEFYPRKTA